MHASCWNSWKTIKNKEIYRRACFLFVTYHNKLTESKDLWKLTAHTEKKEMELWKIPPFIYEYKPRKKQERSASHRAIKIYQQPAHPTSDKTLSSYVYFLVISFSKSIWQPWICIFCPVNHLCLEMQVIRCMLNFDKRHECVRPSLSINRLIITLGLVFVFGYL